MKSVRIHNIGLKKDKFKKCLINALHNVEDAEGCHEKRDDPPFPAVRHHQLPAAVSPIRGKTAAQVHAGRGKENQQLLARQLLKTKSEIVFGSCSNSHDDDSHRHDNMADNNKHLTPESGDTVTLIHILKVI